MSPTPAAVIPPNEETIESYRVAVLAYRSSHKAECQKHGVMKMNNRTPAHRAALAVQAVRPALSYEEAWSLAHQATAWAAQAHNEWFWRCRPETQI